MAITPQDIEQLTFSPSKHGYNTDEVDAFLEQAAVEVDAMLQKIADLKSRLNASEQACDQARAQVAALEAREMSSAPAPVPAASTGATERQISQALIVAQQSADRIVNEARDNAEKIRNEADAKAREVIRQALAEKQNELDEIDRLKASREEFRLEYKNLLQHFMDDAEAAFPSQLLSSVNGTSHAPAPEAPAQDATVYVSNTVIDVDDLD
jgi:cell division initiation protein